MNERLEALKQGVLASFRRARVFYTAHRGLLLSGLTILSILLIVWARFGFTVQVSQFFAMTNQTPEPGGGGGGTPSTTPTATATATATTSPATSTPVGATGLCHWQNPDERNLASCSCNAANRANMCHVCTPSWKEGNTDYSDGQWTAWDNLGLCRPSCPNSIDPYQTERTQMDGSRFPFPQYCVEKPPDCPAGYHAYGNTQCQANAPAPTPVPPQTPTPTPTATPAPTATATVSPTATVTTTTSPSASPTPTVTYSPTPTISSTTMPTSVPVTPFALSISGRNVTTAGVQSTTVQLQGGQEVEVILSIRNTTADATGNSAAALSNVVVRAILPSGLAYLPGSTSINGVATTIDSVTTGGLALGSLVSQQQSLVAFHAKAIASSFVVGTTQVTIPVTVSAINTPSQTVVLPVTVTRTTAGGVGTVKTGPGDAVLVALMMSAIMTLLYVSYTHTSAYKRREIDAITKGRDPLDFRS